MQIITSIDEMRRFSRAVRAQGRTLALVPTMGALHEGHLSLAGRATDECDVAAVSIFVNPAQFTPGEDYARYPRNLECDLDLLVPRQVDAAFAPDAAQIYPPGFDTFVEPGRLAEKLEGAARPGHFRGVATVVVKLLNIVQPDVVCFGQKDFQQAVIVRHLIRDLNLDVRMAVCPVVREPDGLARSSRNAYLDAEDRPAARVLHQSLERARELAEAGEIDARLIVQEMRKTLGREPGVATDYATIVDATDLEPVERVERGSVALVAARAEAVRLIDNLILGPAGATDEDRLELVFGPALKRL
jgi:pantoate--beta-alanine ligase